MAQGGPRPGSGRPKGSVNKRTRELRAHVAASGLSPMDFMLQVMVDPKADPAMRLEAAKAVAPYVHPRLNSTDLAAPDSLEGATVDEVLAHIVALVGKNARLAQALRPVVAEATAGAGDGAASNVVPIKPTAA